MAVNNTFYSDLGDRWYTAQDDPIALLRAEGRIRNPWVLEKIAEALPGPADILDLGCGGGLLSNALAEAGHRVTAIDAAEGALEVARRYDSTRSVDYRIGDVRKLPFPTATFDAVCAMDVLEHVTQWADVVDEAARVLRPGGVFLFYTFNRTFLSWLLAVKGLEWFVKNTPKNVHTYEGFIRPSELITAAKTAGLEVGKLLGMRPTVSQAFFRLLVTGEVAPGFSFRFTPNTQVGYLGTARKR